MGAIDSNVGILMIPSILKMAIDWQHSKGASRVAARLFAGGRRLPVAKVVRHGVGSYADGAVIGPAEWPHHDLIVVTRGGGSFEIREKRWECQAGDALLIPPGLPFLGRALPGGCSIWVQHFFLESADPASATQAVLDVHVWRGGGASAWSQALMERAHTLQTRDQEVGRPPSEASEEVLVLIGLLMDSLCQSGGMIPAERSPGAHRVARTIEWARNHADAAVDLDTLATRAELSPSQFRTLFRQIAGTTAGKFLRDRRLAEAARLLQETLMPIKEISAHLGYSDPAAFHRAFALKTGMTPARFRAHTPPMV